MKLKSYFSGTVEAAMELARKELGEDALLINARPSTPETRSLGAFEVVFGVTSGTAVAGAAHASGTVTAAAESGSDRRLAYEVSDEIRAMRSEIARLTRLLRGDRADSLSNSLVSMPSGDFAEPGVPHSELWYQRLCDSGLDPDLARQIAEKTSPGDLHSAACAIAGLCALDSTLGRPGASRSVVAFVGPPGAGKTTMLVKLAVCYGLTSLRPAHILSTDVYRIAAADQLRSLAAIIGIGCDILETPTALAQSLEAHRNKEYIFIDTPGLGRSDMQEGADLAAFLSSHPEIEVHLVVPASMHASDLARVIDSYAVFQPQKLIFTKLDETDRYGAILAESVRRSMPVSFLATGQRIPDDLEPATPAVIAKLLLGPSAEPKQIGAAA